MLYTNSARFLSVILFLTLLLLSVIQTDAMSGTLYADAQTSPQSTVLGVRRLIVQLNTAPLAATLFEQPTMSKQRVDIKSAAATTYVQRLHTEQAAFIKAMQTKLTDATVATYQNEVGDTQQATYQIVFNGLAIDPGTAPIDEAYRQLAKLPGVKQVYLDQPYDTQLYTSTYLINTPVLWNTIGSQTNAGVGVKIAFMDGGVHHLAPMMSGNGYQYPSGYGPNGLGQTANNNGKIIVSRTYFRPWDAPQNGDENSWPGVNGTSHGMHTASIAAGGAANATYNGFTVGMMSGIAPKAYVMSYRVFYPSMNGSTTFYTTEGLAALEDIVKDGADILNASWGNGAGSSGGQFDPLDQALINMTKAGIFVIVSNGNAGPGLGTSDHPSAAYMNVAASTTSGTLRVGRISVPNESALQNLPFSMSTFGRALPVGQVQTVAFRPASNVDANNEEGCNPFPANSFNGKAALIRRGTCEYGVKVLNAERAGATYAILYNHGSGGDALTSPGPGAVGGQVTISSFFIGFTHGSAMVNLYNTKGAAAATLRMDMTAFQGGNQADRISDLSSRGPGVGGTLKPDLAAPGINILAQGYTEGASGEAVHLGYGQATGTSMAASHVVGAAALVKQVHPDWSVGAIKSALMSTAKYMNIYRADGTTPAQPLDMGSGRLDLTKAADPGVILEPPSLSFGFIPAGTQKTITLTVTSVAATTETYALSTIYTGNGFAPAQTTNLPGFTPSVTTLTLSPGESKKVAITFNSATGTGIGDNQGYVIMDGPAHDAHLAAWARVVPATPLADVLLIDGDFSTLGPSFNYATMRDYRWYYTDTLDKLGYTYTVLDYGTTTLPDAAMLSGYRTIVYFTGDNYVLGAGLAALDMDKLVEYLNAGGTIIVMGQDMAATIDHDITDLNNPHFFYQSLLGANWIQDSISREKTPSSLILPTTSAPAIMANVIVDLTQPRQLSATGPLSGTQEVPPVSTLSKGSFSLFHDIDRNYTEFRLMITPPTEEAITITGMHIHTGVEGNNGPVVRDLAMLGGLTLPKVVTSTLQVAGVISPSMNETELQQLVGNGLYINVHTTVNPSGAIRGQIRPVTLENQPYIDELDNQFHSQANAPNGDGKLTSIPLLYYPGPVNVYHGTVALSHRQQPSLEKPGITYAGRSIYTTFGLEGMSNRFNTALGVTPTTRSEFMALLLAWNWAEPPTAVQLTDQALTASKTHRFEASTIYGQARQTLETILTPAPVRYRWDFGDQSSVETTSNSSVTHAYTCTATNKLAVRVEITDNYGNVIISAKEIDITNSCTGAIVTPPTPTYTPTPTPTDTPEPTATATSTVEATSTATPSSTPTDQPPQSNGSTLYMPLVQRPLPTNTPMAQPSWQRIGQTTLNLRTVAIHNGQLFIGERKQDGVSLGGLYQRPLNNCETTPDFTRLSTIQNSSVFGLAFQNSQAIAATYDTNLFYSNNNGIDWQQSNTAVPRPRSVVIAGGNVFYAGTEDSGIYESTTGGTTWQQLDTNPSNINRVSINTNTLWIGSEKGVFKRTLGGLTPLTDGLSNTTSKKVWDFAFQSVNEIYIATFDGVYKGDGINAWQPIGLQGKNLYSIELYNDFLYAGVHQGGVWQRPLSGGNWSEVVSPHWGSAYSVHDLFFDPSTCNGLLAATEDGLWLYR